MSLWYNVVVRYKLPRRISLEDQPRLFHVDPELRPYGDFTNAEVERLWFLDRDTGFVDHDLNEEFERRIARALLRAFDEISRKHPNVRLAPSLRRNLLGKAGYE